MESGRADALAASPRAIAASGDGSFPKPRSGTMCRIFPNHVDKNPIAAICRESKITDEPLTREKFWGSAKALQYLVPPQHQTTAARRAAHEKKVRRALEGRHSAAGMRRSRLNVALHLQ